MLPLLPLPISNNPKRRRARDGSEFLNQPDAPTEDQRLYLRDRDNWKDVVCEVWNGRVSHFSPRAAMSPDADWRKRQYVEDAQVVAGYLRSTCKVIRNKYNFEPNGEHNMDMLDLGIKLMHHYLDEENAVEYSSLPKGSAHTADIQKWVDGIPPPAWTTAVNLVDTDPMYRHWKLRVRSKARDGIEFQSDGVGGITYANGQKYIGETTTPASGKKIPNGLGVLTFPDGAMWRGRWKNGSRTTDIGVFTDADGTTTLGTWMNGTMKVKSTTAIAIAELEMWNSAHAMTQWSDRFLVEKPGYGRIAVASGQVGGVLRMANWHTEAAISRMMATTNPFELGKGRDTEFYMEEGHAYTKLLPLSVFDIDYSNSYILQDWERYQGQLARTMSSELGRSVSNEYGPSRATRMELACPAEGFRTPDGRLIDSNLASLGVPLRKETNERFLLHAIKPESLFAILNTSFDVSYASRGMFGAGTYFSDDPGKCDQYALPARLDEKVCKRLGLDRKYILETLRKHSAYSKVKAEQMGGYREDVLFNEGDDTDRLKKDTFFDIFFMFVTRVPLGIAAVPDDYYKFKENRLPVGDPRSMRNRGEDDPMDDDNLQDKLFLDGDPGTNSQPGNMGYVRKLNEPYGSVSCKGGLRYREFIVYQNAVSRPSHLIAYARAREVRTHDINEDDSDEEDAEYEISEDDKEKILKEDGTAVSDADFMTYSDPFDVEKQ